MRKICTVLMCAPCLWLLSCSSAPATQFKAISTTQDVMAGVIDPTAQTIWQAVKIEIDEKGTHETRPQTKEDWQKLGHVARSLADSSSLLLFEGHLEDHANWEKFTKEMADKAMDVARAADDQDVEKIISTGGDLYEACTKCHMEYLDRVLAKRTGSKPPAGPSAAPGATPASEPTTK
jgi:hypothetical protein